MGHLEVRLAVGDAEIEAAQQLRYRVFYEEMSAVASPDMARVGRDFDDFDDYCDHLLVLDHAARAGEQVVGTYRLLRQEVATAHDGFYTNTEYDIEPLLKRAKPGTQFLELGRSCVQKEYRNRPTVELLWHGIMAYVAFHSMDVMFGCASFTGTDTEQLALPLSFLFHQYLAPEEWRVRALDPIRVEMNRMPKDAINVREAVRSLPPLVKGYVRAGAYIGDGAVVDTQFDTTDVLIVFPVNKMNDRYFSRFGKDERPSNGATNDQ
jgi:putative hemolysin